MTIYKTVPADKKSGKGLLEAEVSAEPLNGPQEIDDLEIVAPKVMRVTYNPRRTRTLVNLCLITAVLIVLGIGGIGTLYLYKHLSNRVVGGRCGVSFYDEEYTQQSHNILPINEFEPLKGNLRYLEEEVVVSEIEQYEELKVPEFDECEETVVFHDFGMNYTAIIDHHLAICYIMPLNRTLIAPPKNLIDLVLKFKHGYYTPSAKVIRSKYRQVLPPIDNVSKYGRLIDRQCFMYNTYRLVKLVDGVYKRSVDSLDSGKIHHYGFATFKDAVFKMTIVPQ